MRFTQIRSRNNFCFFVLIFRLVPRSRYHESFNQLSLPIPDIFETSKIKLLNVIGMTFKNTEMRIVFDWGVIPSMQTDSNISVLLTAKSFKEIKEPFSMQSCIGGSRSDYFTTPSLKIRVKSLNPWLKTSQLLSLWDFFIAAVQKAMWRELTTLLLFPFE